MFAGWRRYSPPNRPAGHISGSVEIGPDGTEAVYYFSLDHYADVVVEAPADSSRPQDRTPAVIGVRELVARLGV